jgi:hypothetical protein
MADDLTLAEIARNLARLELGQQKLGDRITESAREAVPAQLWTAERDALTRQIIDHTQQASKDLARLEQGQSELRKTHERDVARIREDTAREFEKQRATTSTSIEALRTEITEQPVRWADKAWTRILASSALLVTLAGVVVAALSLGKG